VCIRGLLAGLAGLVLAGAVDGIMSSKPNKPQLMAPGHIAFKGECKTSMLVSVSDLMTHAQVATILLLYRCVNLHHYSVQP
jgi:hypothetical protein